MAVPVYRQRVVDDTLFSPVTCPLCRSVLDRTHLIMIDPACESKARKLRPEKQPEPVLDNHSEVGTDQNVDFFTNIMAEDDDGGSDDDDEIGGDYDLTKYMDFDSDSESCSCSGYD